MRDWLAVIIIVEGSFYIHSVNALLLIYYQGKSIIVFYGSQTGTGEEFANRLSKDAQRYGMKGMSADPEEYDMVICISGTIYKLQKYDLTEVLFILLDGTQCNY